MYIRAIRGVPSDMKEKLPGEYHKVLDTTVRLMLCSAGRYLIAIFR